MASLDLHCSGVDRKHVLRHAAFVLGWALLFVGCMAGIRFGGLASPWSWFVAAVPSVAAIVVMVEFHRFLRACDELQRLIQLQALAIGFGGGFFLICGYSLFEQAGAPEVSALDLAVAMPFLYSFAVLIGERRYR